MDLNAARVVYFFASCYEFIRDIVILKKKQKKKQLCATFEDKQMGRVYWNVLTQQCLVNGAITTLRGMLAPNRCAVYLFMRLTLLLLFLPKLIKFDFCLDVLSDHGNHGSVFSCARLLSRIESEGCTWHFCELFRLKPGLSDICAVAKAASGA